MFCLKNKKIITLLRTLNLRPELSYVVGTEKKGKFIAYLDLHVRVCKLLSLRPCCGFSQTCL